MELPTSLPYAENPVRGAVQTLVVLLHGYGADEHDLVSLQEDFPSDFHLVCLGAPLRMAMGGRCWFELGWAGEDFVPDLDGARAALPIAAAEIARHQARFTGCRLVLGGFSQGAMMSLVLAGRGEVQPDALWLMSGAVLGPLLPENPTPLPPTLVQHGVQDQVVSIERGRQLANFVREHAPTADVREYPMAHTISPASYSDAMAWLRNLDAHG